MKKILFLALVFLLPSSAFASFTLTPSSGYVEDGYLYPVRAEIGDIIAGSYFLLDSPSVVGSTCQVLPSYVGGSAGWDDITDFEEVGTWTLYQYSQSDCTDLVESHTFTLSLAPVPPSGGVIASSTAVALVGSTLSGFGLAALAVLGAIIGVALAILIVRWGWKSLMNLPGGFGYDPSKGSGMSRFQRGRRNAKGGVNLLG